jgi:broad specificity phosphatase PhoE
MKLVFVRHGQTDVNSKNLINGLNDEGLNEKGIEQAKSIIDKIKSYDYDFIICSPLSRARETANIINIKNKDIIYDNRIIERDAGYLTLTPAFSDESDWWNVNPKCDYKDSELVRHIIERIYNFIDEQKNKYSNKTIIVVTHGGIMRCVNTYFHGIPDDGDLSKINFDNCDINEYDV